MSDQVSDQVAFKLLSIAFLLALDLPSTSAPLWS